MNEERETVRLRAACDRCHAHKLRCPKSVVAGACDRCSKARQPCVFSPFRQKKVISRSQGKQGDTVSVNAKLSRLEKQIHIVESNIKSPSPKRRCMPQPSPDDFTPAPDVYSPDSLLEASTLHSTAFETSGFDWSSIPLQDFEVDAAFDETAFGLELPLSPVAPTFTNVNGVYFGSKPNETFQFEIPPARYEELNVPSTNHTHATIPPRLPPKNRAVYSEWENPMNKEHPRSEGSLIRQLSKLNVGLYDHLGTIPPQCIHDQLPDGRSVSEIRTDLTDKYSLDETFQLTQELIDIYPVFLDAFVKGSSTHEQRTSGGNLWSGGLNDSTSISTSDGIDSGPTLDLKSATSDIPVSYDHSSILLLLSCHVRILDIYDEIFKHMNQCSGQPPSVVKIRQASCKRPEMRIGNYIPPPSSALPMQMMLCVQLASQLSDAAGELASHLQLPENPPTPDSTDSSPTITEAAKLSCRTAELVSSRASKMFEELRIARSRFLEKGGFA